MRYPAVRGSARLRTSLFQNPSSMVSPSAFAGRKPPVSDAPLAFWRGAARMPFVRIHNPALCTSLAWHFFECPRIAPQRRGGCACFEYPATRWAVCCAAVGVTSSPSRAR